MKRPVCFFLCLLFGALAACVGPARTDRAYVRKAVDTAKAVVSAAETARLAADAAGRGNTTGQYLSILFGETEDAAGAAAAAFDSVQPPSKGAGALHDRLAVVIDSAVEVLRDLRIAARRTDLASLPRIARGLTGPAGTLRTFVESNE